jgi:two-component system sensor histidine kinase PilS (NtrC family)
MLGAMDSQQPNIDRATVRSAPFLPLAFRLGACFGLLVAYLALPQAGNGSLPGEPWYLGVLALLFLESVWEAHHSVSLGRTPFATPAKGWIRFNLLLDAALITLVIAFQGVDRAQLATLYIFPVLASAFYLTILEIVAVAVISSSFHIASSLLFLTGVLPTFGRSWADPGLDPGRLGFILGFAVLQIFAAALVVVVIRKHLEDLRRNLSRSESVVDELSNLYQRVFESMFSGLITVDLQGRITSANQAAQNILHRPLEPGSLIDDQGFGALAELGDRMREGRFELEVSTPEDDRRIVGGNLVNLAGPGGRESGRLLVFQDLTQLKMLEERTRTSERLAAVGELTSAMAHELRNPMASILGCVQILKQGEHPRAMMDRVITILSRESERVSGLVSDFLDFTRPRAARIQALHLPDIIDEVRASWETDPRNAGLDMDIGRPPDLWVLGDTAWVHQIFTNLLSNARKALRDRQEPGIRFGYQARRGTVTVAVADRGCGMTEERRRMMFIPFSSGFDEGTGLGMSLVFQFVQRMGWSIRVESVLGRGTIVSLTMPVQELSVPVSSIPQS